MANVGAVNASTVAAQVVRELTAGVNERLESYQPQFVRRMSFNWIVEKEKNKAQAEASRVIERNRGAVERYVSNPFTLKSALRDALSDAGVEAPRLNDEAFQVLAKELGNKVTTGSMRSDGLLGRVGSPPGDTAPMRGKVPETVGVATALLNGVELRIAEIAAQFLA